MWLLTLGLAGSEAAEGLRAMVRLPRASFRSLRPRSIWEAESELRGPPAPQHTPGKRPGISPCSPTTGHHSMDVLLTSCQAFLLLQLVSSRSWSRQVAVRAAVQPSESSLASHNPVHRPLITPHPLFGPRCTCTSATLPLLGPHGNIPIQVDTLRIQPCSNTVGNGRAVPGRPVSRLFAATLTARLGL